MTEHFNPLEFKFWLPVLVSLLCGLIVGLERQLRGKPLDVRTAVLICLGTHIFIRLGTQYGGGGDDAMRVLGQVVTGIGFLGAGVILTRGQYVMGLTTAAVIWVLAAIVATSAVGPVILGRSEGQLFRDQMPLDGSALPPNSMFLLGTDRAGHDLFSELMYAGRATLLLGVAALALTGALVVLVRVVI